MIELFDFPVWKDCPFRKKVPRIYKIRKGTYVDSAIEYLIISYETEGCVKHASMRLSDASRGLKPLVGNLGSSIFEERHPEEFLKLIRRDALRARYQEPTPLGDQILWKEYRDLTELAGTVAQELEA